MTDAEGAEQNGSNVDQPARPVESTAHGRPLPARPVPGRHVGTAFDGILRGLDNLDGKLVGGAGRFTDTAEVATSPPLHWDEYTPGSDADFSRLYSREALPLTRTVYAIVGSRQEAEDCVQEAFVRAYKKWPTYQPTAPARFWVQRIAINLAISRRRSDRLVAARNRLLARSARPAPDKDGERLDLMTALRKLPVKQLTAVLLRFNHGYNNREIGVTLGISERAVGQRVQSGLDRLKVLLDDPVAA